MGIKLTMEKTNYRKYKRYEFEFEKGIKNPTAQIIKKLKTEDIEGCVIQINISISETDLIKLNIDEINSYAESKDVFRIRPILPIIQRERKNRQSDITADLTPLEAVRMFIEEMKPEDAEDILELATAIVREEL